MLRSAPAQNQGLLSLKQGEAVLIVAASTIDSNLFYASSFLAGDPITYLQIGSKKMLLLPELELGRGREEASVDEVHSLLPWDQKIRKEKGRAPKLSEIQQVFLKEHNIERLIVPQNFPIGQADPLRDAGFEILVRKEPFFTDRAIKTDQEIENVARTQAITVEAMHHAIQLIAKASIQDDLLFLNGTPLLAEDVRLAIHRYLFDRGYHAENTIVAAGDQACDPHNRGSGHLPAHKPIVIDIFPRSLSTRYWGDMTRTILKGEASDEIISIYNDVLEAQKIALSHLKAGVDGSEVHGKVKEYFTSQGRITQERNGKMEGFFHSTGHGLGLDIHEHPKIGRARSPLEAGNTVTSEPGLYYPGIGGVRLEDTVLITEGGHRNLTDYPNELIV